MRGKSDIQSRILEFSCLGICLVLVLGIGITAKAQKQTAQMKYAKTATTEAQVLYQEYRGIRIGMTTLDTRTKLGEPTQKADDQDFYVFSPNETAQIAYNAAHKVVTISTDYLAGVGAPDYKAVVGGELEELPNGSLYRMVRYDRLGFWVSYNKSATTVPIITITIQAEPR